MSIINQIKTKLNLAEFIGKDTDLTYKGNYYSGCCPIHGEKNPSFAVYDGFFRCYSCGAEGSIIDYYMLKNDCDLNEALCYFCNLLDITSNSEEDMVKPAPYFTALRNIESEVKEHVVLNEDLVNEYAKVQHVSISDQFSEEVIKTFKIGFCTNIYDGSFYNRIIFPVYNVKNELVGLIGRKITEGKEQKYVFSTGFNKSAFLYGLNVTLPYIKQEKCMVIVEGSRDVLALYNAGVRNVVASLGCKPSREQIDLIYRYCNFNVIIGYDSDDAGENGYRYLKEALGKLVQIRRMNFGNSKDAGECSNRELIEYYREVLT